MGVDRRPRCDALAIMRRLDVGPLVLVILRLVPLIEVTALAAAPAGRPVAGPVLAVVTGRVAAAPATGVAGCAAGWARRPAGRAAPAGPPGLRPRLCPLAAVVLVGWPSAAALCGARAGRGAGRAAGRAACWPGSAWLRLAGMTGDVFGAIIEEMPSSCWCWSFHHAPALDHIFWSGPRSGGGRPVAWGGIMRDGGDSGSPPPPACPAQPRPALPGPAAVRVSQVAGGVHKILATVMLPLKGLRPDVQAPESYSRHLVMACRA